MRIPKTSQTDGAAGSADETGSEASGITPRGVGIGLLMVLVIVGMTQVLSIHYDAAEVGGDAPPPAPTYLLFLYILLAAPLLSRLSRRFALRRGELLLIYTLMIIAGPITHPYSIGFLVPHTVSPLYYNVNEPHWSAFAPALPAWFGPGNPTAVAGFFRGTHGSVPWQAWFLPILAWSSLLIALFCVMLCINVLMRRQWIENERLAFPLAAIPLALTEEAGRMDGGGRKRGDPLGSVLSAIAHPSQILRQPLFWLGVALPLALQAPAALHRYFPVVPEIPLRDVAIVKTAAQLPPPWNGIGTLSFSLIFWLVGVVYLIPKEIALSAWLFYFIALLENVAAIWLGHAGEAPSVYSNAFPALYAQGAGAAFALTAITLYTARHHLGRIVRKAFRKDRAIDDRDELLSYRTALFGAIGGTAFILCWLCLAGMRLWVAGLFFGLMLSYFFIFARIRAETGLGMGVILWPKMLDEVMLTFVGARYLTLADLTVLHAVRWLYFGSATGSVMACQLEGFKLADVGGMRGHRVGRILAWAAALTVPLALAWTLKTYYQHGFESMPIGNRNLNMVGSQVYWSYYDLSAALDTPKGPEAGGILAILAGAGIATALSWLRVRYLWFPLHPVGFLAANSWGMQINWASFLIGWLIVVSITRYGGLPVYRRLLPLFLGLIVGDMLHEGVWGMVTWATGGRM
jgi:hypothetical protein